MRVIPREGALQSALGLLREGYPFIRNRCQRLGSDLFEIGLPFKKVVCMTGPQAASIFYDQGRFARKGAIPKRVQKTLLGEESLHTLDDAAHRHRKAMFMSVMSPESIRQLMVLIADQWRTYLAKWERMDRVVLFEEVQEILCRAVCSWAGIPLKENEVGQRARAFAARIDAFGAFGLRHWRGRWARRSTERWVMALINDIRSGKLTVAADKPAYLMACSPDFNGQPMDTHMAAVELINLVRPTVAISWYIAFVALALHQYPRYMALLRTGKSQSQEHFVQEVRRFYPFAPFVGANVRQAFDWQGYRFHKGTLVLLDIYGTNHDGRQWERPDEFWPERFEQAQVNPFNLIPQGGGNHHPGHRCPGEWITIEATKLALTFLTDEMSYQVPDQDLGFSLSRIPTFPKSGVVITQVRRQAAVDPVL